MKQKRNIYTYFILTIVTILFGLLSRSQHIHLPAFVSAYAGDTLWALMVFLIFCMLAGQMKTWKVSILALLFSFAIELSQLYQAPWINNIRNTFPAGLLLGYGFKISDLVCYSLGILSGVFIDLLLIRKLND